MVRPPFAARVMTGLLVTALEETRKLPTTAVTLPMTAISTTVQVAMRLQQNIAELAIKGDDALDHWFHRAQEQPSWATFDEDLDALRVDDIDDAPAVSAVTDEVPSPPDAPAADETPAPAPTKAATKATATAPAKKAPATTSAAKKAPTKKAPTKKATAAKAPATPGPGSADEGSVTSGEGVTAKGRFALYSSAPDTVLQSEVEAAPTPTPSDAPEIVEFLDYDSLTLAQLRAKIRSIDVDDLRTLAEYERSHRGRAPFATMLDNRIAAAGAK
jgi:hypothetical protein